MGQSAKMHFFSGSLSVDIFINETSSWRLGMKQMMSAALLFFLLFLGVAEARPLSLKCKITEGSVPKVESLRISDGSFIINGETEIPLEETRVNCGNFKKRVRLDGYALGYQVILEGCTMEAKLAGDIIDVREEKIATLHCN